MATSSLSADQTSGASEGSSDKQLEREFVPDRNGKFQNDPPPFCRDVLLDKSLSATSAIFGAVQASEGPISDTFDTKKILIAEDDLVSLRLIENTVQKWGYETTCVKDGASALAKLSANNGPRIAILDWEMPGLSGPQVCRILRARTSKPYVYLIVLTGRSSKEALVAGLASGADDYVLKPFDPTELHLRVRTGQRIVDLQSELLNARRELERRANHDALTGAANRGAILTKIEQEASRAARQNTSYCLILFDLDFFKKVNDSYGHRAGDCVLVETVRRAELELRPYDMISRYGGEEFMILLPGCELEAGLQVAERLRERLCKAPVVVDRLEIKVTASFGIVSSALPHTSLEGLVDAADSALYRAKGNGRNKVEIARVSESRPAQRRTSSASALSEGTNARLSFAVSQSTADSSPAESPMSPVLDRSVLAQVQDLVEDGSEFLQGLFAKYVSTADTTVSILASDESLDKKRRATHTLRGASLSIGAAGVADACRRFERRVRAHADAETEELVEDLRMQVERVRERYPLEIDRMMSRQSRFPLPS